MNKWAKWFNSFYMALLLMLGVNYAYAYQTTVIGNDVLPDSASLYLSDVTAVVGSLVEVDVLLNNATGTQVNSIQFGVKYDTALVALEGTSPNEDFFADFTYIINDSIPGVVYFSAASSEGLLASGELLQLQFMLKQIGATQLSFTSELLNEGNPPVAVIGGQLIIEPEPDSIPPAQPNDLRSALLNASTAQLTWLSGQDEDLKQYYVYQLAGRPNPNWGNEIQEMPWLLEDVNLRDSLQVGTPAPLQALFTIELDGLDNLSYYTFWVTALDSAGNESVAKMVTLRAGDTEQPNSPAITDVQYEDKTITLSWTESTSEDIAGYVLYRAEESLEADLLQSETNAQRVTTTPGEVEWVVLNDWDSENQRHRVLLDKREFPESVDPADVSALQLFDVYDGPVVFGDVGSGWITYFIPDQISDIAIQASTEKGKFRRIQGSYGVRAELDFEPLNEVPAIFEFIDLLPPNQLRFTDDEILSSHIYRYRLAAIDSANGDPLVSFDPELRSDFSATLPIETPAFSWRVNPTGEADFEYIQNAIDASQSGDTILVDPGKYVEQLYIGHPLIIHGTGDLGEARLVKPPFADTLMKVSAHKYSTGRWPLNERLTLESLDILGTEEVATSGVGIALSSGTKMRMNQVQMRQFVEVFNTFEASYFVSNSIFYENRRLGSHQNLLDPDASGADSITYKHVNMLNTYDLVSNAEGAIAIEFRNSILANEWALKRTDSPFQGASVRLIDVAMDTNLVRTGIDKVGFNQQETRFQNYIASLVHINTLDQVLFKRLYAPDTEADYRLRDQSKLIGQGLPIPELMKDFAGISRHIAPDKRVDLGAFEHPSDTPELFEAPFIQARQVALPTMDPLGKANQAIELTLSVPDSLRSFLDALYLFKHDAQGQLIRVDTLQPGTFVDAEIEEGRRYQYSAKAVYYEIYESQGSQKQSVFISDITPPPPVDSLAAVRLNTRIFEFNWKADTKEALSVYRIYRAPSAGLAVQALVDTVDTTWIWNRGSMSLEQLKSLEINPLDSIVVNNQEISGANSIIRYVEDDLLLENRTHYTYWITAVDTSYNESDPEFIQMRTGDDVPPKAPTNLRQTVQNTRIILQWDPSPDQDVAFYRIYRGSDSLSVTIYDSVQANRGTFIDDSLENTLSLFYRISAVDSMVGDPAYTFDPALESELSASTPGYFVDRTGPSKPIIESFSSSNSLVQFSWSRIPDSDLALHTIYRGSHPDTVSLLKTISKDINSFSDSTVVNSEEYFYYVAGVDTANNEGERSDVIYGTPFNLPPQLSSYQDQYVHNQSLDQFNQQFPLQVFDPDGSIDSTIWIVNGKRESTSMSPEITLSQGSTSIMIIAEDNSGDRDTTDFSVYVDAGYLDLGVELAPTSGLSLFGNDFSFHPDVNGNLNLMAQGKSNEFSLTAPLRAPVSIASDSSFYLLSGTNKISKYSLFNWWKHKITVPYWSTTTGGIHEASAVVDEARKRLYMVSKDNQIFAISTSNGVQDWRSNIGGPGKHPGVILSGKYLAQPNILGDVVYFNLDGSISFKEMSPIGSTVFADSLQGALAVTSDQHLVAGFNSGAIRKWNPNLNSSDAASIIWETNLEAKVSTTPVIASDGTVLIGAADSTFYGINGNDGQIIWTFSASDVISSTASINEYGVIYFGDASGGLYALDASGQLIWEYRVKAEPDTDDGGESGTLIQDGRRNRRAIMNTINYANGSVFFATNGGKILSVRDGWRYDGSIETEFGPEWERSFAQWATYQGNYRRSGSVEGLSATSNQVAAEVPTQFNLSQNYPNPFNPSTKIEFALPEAAEVRIDVFNMLGQKVQTLKNERMAAGYYSVTFEAGGLSSGVYVYQLRMGNAVLTKRMLLLK
jgi:outer membrane protein assembly factor BamB/fibronectin type 3 domain-containing protein